MYLKKTKLIALIFMLSAAEVAAQGITGSPYSRYGIGDISNPGTGHNVAMGGTSVAESSPMYVNTVNPACNTNLPLQRFVFDVGFDVKYNEIKSATASEKTSKATFKYLVGGFAAKPWWYFSFSMKPYSAMGYAAASIDSSNVMKLNGIDYKFGYRNSFDGKGGLNKVSISTAFKFFKVFSLGFTGSVLFGDMERTQKSYISRSGYVINGTTYPYTSTYYMSDKRVMYGTQGDIGLRFEKRFTSKKDSLRDALRISLGAYMSSSANLTARDEIFVQDYHTYYSYYYNGTNYYTAKADTIANDTISKSKVSIPKGFGIGASVEIAEKFTINADYQTQEWGSFQLPDDASKTKYRDSKYMGFGMQFVENLYSSKYYRRIIYRVGAYKQNTYLELNGQGIDDKGITFGIGMPVGMLMLNVSCQLGSRGTTEHNLYKEKYFLVHFNATLHDYWFIKRKFQ
ncbi:MAG: hypothetical protein IKM98_08825 [Bacteroidales bacterium]|nr:hypothetical protein [Bacteroidales bacterium]